MLIGTSGSSAGVIDTDVCVVSEDVQMVAVTMDIAYTGSALDGIHVSTVNDGINGCEQLKHDDYVFQCAIGAYDETEVPYLIGKQILPDIGYSERSRLANRFKTEEGHSWCLTSSRAHRAPRDGLTDC